MTVDLKHATIPLARIYLPGIPVSRSSCLPVDCKCWGNSGLELAWVWDHKATERHEFMSRDHGRVNIMHNQLHFGVQVQDVWGQEMPACQGGSVIFEILGHFGEKGRRREKDPELAKFNL